MIDLGKIDQALKSEMPKEIIRLDILRIIARDEAALPDLIHILEAERERKKALILEMNLQLSRAHMALIEPKLNEDGFVKGEISKFYQNNKDELSHCYKVPERHG